MQLQSPDQILLLDVEAAVHLATRCRDSLTHLNLSWCEEVTEAALTQLCGTLERLRVVKLRCMAVGDTVLAALAERGGGLEVLDIGRSQVNGVVLESGVCNSL